MKFKDIERGWASDSSEVQVQNTTVDNVVTNWSYLTPDGDDLCNANLDPFEGESRPDYWIERLVVHFQPYAIPASPGNTRLYVDFWCGLAVVSRAMAVKEDVPEAATLRPFWDDTFRSIPEVSRILRVEPRRAYLRGLAESGETGLPEAYQPEPVFGMWDVKNLFLRRNEAVVVCISQTGSQDDFSVWVNTDIGGIAWMSQALIRQKQGR